MVGQLVSRCIRVLTLSGMIVKGATDAISACRGQNLGTQCLQRCVINRYVPPLIFRCSLFVILTTFSGVGLS